MRYENVKDLKNEDFKRLTGVTRSTFEKMLEVVEKGRRGFGRPLTLMPVGQLLMALTHWREYRAEFHLGLAYGVNEATVCRMIQKVENVLIKSKQTHLPGKEVFPASDLEIEVVLIDATEQPVERPKKRQRRHYSGKKKRHTQKAQVIMNKKTEEILATAFCWGGKQDFQLLKDSRIALSRSTRKLADAGYQGLAQLHDNSRTPAKKTTLHPLTKEQKTSNRALSQERIRIENVICRLEVFRILSERYRNRRKWFAIRFNLIAAICNFELKAA